MSEANRRFLGFQGFFPIPGLGLIVGDQDVAKVWEVIEDEPDYKYDHLVLSWYPLLSSISFDRFKLPNKPFMIQFPNNNLQPGSPAQLGLMLPQAPNQVWTMTKGGSFSLEFLFYTQTHSFK
jgi:hypothetical protein